MRACQVLTLALLCAGAAAPASASASPFAAVSHRAVRAVRATGPLQTGWLSNERTITRWAYPTRRAQIYAAPRQRPLTGQYLRYQTEDAMPEVYLVRRAMVLPNGFVWLKIRIPGRPNGRLGWVPRGALGELHHVATFLDVDKTRERATLYENRHIIWRSSIGVGKHSTPTPSGDFYIRERLRNLGGERLYGPWAFGTSAYSVLSDWPGGGVIGIHGTDQPELIPGRPSHGCIRIPNRKIRGLARLMPVGTPVHIHA